ncbi:MAG: serine/threonine-protein phosphatase, partial [Hyphomicrobiaceae bacterium]|nr:serine/threonine-protein phosphatase [Hyphomicrobiaceae bacterium]
MMQFDIAARTTKGGRPYQEDAFKIVDVAGESRVGDATAPYATLGESCFVLVADGVGGEFGGNIASGTLKDSFPAHFAKAEGSTEARLASALDSANEDLAHRKEEDAQLRHMASTLLAGAFDGKSLTFLSVGDSPIYRVRNGEIHRINADHRHDVEIDLQAVRKSLSDRRKGREKPVDQDDPFGDVWTVALSDRQRSAITSAVTGEEILHRHIATSAVRDGDVFVFASDGIELLSLEHIRSYTMTLLEEGTVDDLADALLMTVERHGEAFAGNAHDNTTFVVVKAHEDTAETTIIETPEARSATRTSAAPGFAAPPK